MAKVIDKRERVQVLLSAQELNQLLVAPAQERGFIDFQPTRVQVNQEGSGFMIVFESVEVPGE